jgi:short-subunit dehydrogenase
MFGLLFGYAWSLFACVASVVGIISCATYVVVQLYQLVCKPQNLKQKYNAEWALVTGASSGIGKSLVERLAQQGIHVVLVALDDKVLAETFPELQAKYPKINFRKVGVNLGATNESEYMKPIVEATSDITVALVFNNAGFILPGFFAESKLDAVKTNYNCNSTSAVVITHHFLNRLQQEKRKGLIAFTSSAGAYFPGPTAVMYAATKAFLTSFAVSLAGELRDVGIDIVVVHPSPVQSNFYIKANTANVLASLQTAMKAAVSPFVIADCIFASAGKLVVWDQGSTCAVFRLVLKTVDFAFFNEVTSRLACRFNPDHAMLAKQSPLRRK